MGCGAASQRRGTADMPAAGGPAKPRAKHRIPAVLSHHHVRVMGDATPGGPEAGQLPRGHGTAVYCVRWSPCGRFVLSAARDGKLCLWSVDDGTRLRTWEDHQGFVLSCAYSPASPVVCSTSDDRSVKLWSTEVGAPGAARPLCTLSGHSHKVYASEFSPDGRFLITGSMDRLVKVWDVEAQRLVRDLAGHSKSVFTCTCPGDSVAASGGDDNLIKIWDWRAGGDAVRSLTGHAKTVWSVRVSPDGSGVLSTGMDTEVRDWDMGSGQVTRVYEGHKAPVHAALYCHDGQGIVSAGRDNHIRVWERASGEVVDRITGHEAAIYSTAVSPEGELIATCSLDESIRVWKMPAEKFGCASPTAGDGLELDIDFDLGGADPDGADPWGGGDDGE